MKPPKVLVIDDNELNLRMLDLILKNVNYDIRTSLSGAEGLEIASEYAPDLILLDIMMPEMDGFEVCKRLKSNPETANIPVIFLTSKTDTDGIVRGFELGAADYVTRPFNRIELLARLRTHLALRISSERILELERKNSILAMGTTTNHEINQPLTVLTGNLYLLMNSLEAQTMTDEQRESIEKMNKAIMKIKDLLAKYQNASSARLANYAGKTKMIVFDD